MTRTSAARLRVLACAVLFSTGVEARGTGPIQAMVNLVLLTGNLGKPGAGLLALAATQ